MTSIRFLADEDFNEHIVAGVRRREPAVEFFRVHDFGLQGRPDSEVLELAIVEQLLLASHDVNTMSAEAVRRMDAGLGLAGLLMVPQSVPVSDVIESLLLIWSESDLEDWSNQIVFLPL